MKALSEQNHYEVLEVARNVSREEIERAYRLVRDTYAEDSLAGYSIFQEGDVATIRGRIEAAYQVLSDADSRRAYDAALAAVGDPPGPVSQPGPDAPDLAGPAPEPQLGAFDDFGDEHDDYDGARLRRSRLRRGMEIEDVARVTKVNPAYLRFIEEERFGDLPARVYVRGFVMAYASCVGLEPRSMAGGYLQRFDRGRAPPRRATKRA